MESFVLAGESCVASPHDRLIVLCAAVGFCSVVSFGTPVHAGELLVEEAAYYRDVGHQFQTDGQIDQAMDAYAKATLCYPGYADAHNDLAVMYEAKGQLGLAETEYLKALQVNPNHAAAHMNLAMLYEMQGKMDHAVPHWQARVRIGPARDPWAKSAREMLIRNEAKVPEPLSASRAKRGGAIALAYEEGTFYLDRQRWAEAGQAFERVLNLDPTHRGARDGLQRVREQLPSRAGRMLTSPASAWAPHAAATPAMDEAHRRRQEEVMQREVERMRQEAAAKEAQRREQERRQQEAQRLMQQANELAKQAQAMEQRAQSLRQQTGSRPSAGARALPVAPARTTTSTLPPMRAATEPEPMEGYAEDEEPIVPRKNLWSKMKFWERWGERRGEAAATIAEPTASQPTMWTPSAVPTRPVAIAPATQATLATPRPIASGPIKPISTQSEARALAEQLARERQRTRDLMAREFYQRGVILYRQGQYGRSIEQFQRALSIDPNHRESQQYMRDAQTALAQGE